MTITIHKIQKKYACHFAKKLFFVKKSLRVNTPCMFYFFYLGISSSILQHWAIDLRKNSNLRTLSKGSHNQCPVTTIILTTIWSHNSHLLLVPEYSFGRIFFLNEHKSYTGKQNMSYDMQHCMIDYSIISQI